MTTTEIQEKVRDSLDGNSATNIMMLQHISGKLKSLIAMGNEHDADSICHLSKAGQDISVVFIVGRSMLTGEEARKWLLEYHNNNPFATKRWIEQVADFAVDGLAGYGECVMPFKDSKTKRGELSGHKPMVVCKPLMKSGRGHYSSLGGSLRNEMVPSQ